jgi:hypothetical protein
MIHDLSGAIIDVGRRTRKPPPALRRALRERDRGRCQYPGCASHRTDAHHIRHWANGGQTSLANLISFCKGHHRLVHENGYIIAATDNGFAFFTKDGTPIPGCPQLPQGPGDITTTHDAAITPTTINPPHSGERLNLSLAIWIAFANARTQAARGEAIQSAMTSLSVKPVSRRSAAPPRSSARGRSTSASPAATIPTRGRPSPGPRRRTATSPPCPARR